MTEPQTSPDDAEIERMPTLVPGLDAILCGGFMRGGLYMIQGPPGAGKTTLASQIIFNRARGRSRTLYVTMLGESHGRMMAHLRRMGFFDQSLIPDHIAFVSAYQILEDEGLTGLWTLLRREAVSRQTTLLVVDGMSAIEAKTRSDFDMKRFAYDLEVLAASTNCTIFLLTTASSVSSAPEATMVDGLLELRQCAYGPRNERRAVVHKLRGSEYLEGEHAFRITRDGLVIFPRIEALLGKPTSPVAASAMRVPFGVASLDVMFGGGVPAATVGAVVGASGAGKTTLGLHFLSGCSAGQPGLLFGCYEPPERLRYKAATMGFDLAAAEQRGDVEILWYPLGEYILDELAHRLLEAVRRRNVKRLVIDGMSVFQQAALEPERMVRFWSALSNELRALGVTTLHALEQQELSGPEVRFPMAGLSSLGEVMVLLRYVELRSRRYRLISLLKVREGAFDPTIREFAIGDSGIVVGMPFDGAEGGTGRPEAVLSEIGGEAPAASGAGRPG
jgi:circadian clock protein KaiC